MQVGTIRKAKNELIANRRQECSMLAIVGYIEEAGARTEQRLQSTNVEFEVIPFECVGRDAFGFGMAAKSRGSLCSNLGQEFVS